MKADGCYGECVVPRRPTLSGAVLRSAMVGLCALFVLLGLGVSPLFILVAVIAIYITMAVWPRFDVVYEYIFVDGQLDFDKILGGNARKHALRIDMEKVDIVAPVNSHALDGYKHLNLKPIDYTSLVRDDEHKVFAIMYKGEQNVQCIWFEPNAELLALMRYKAPRKVVEV